MTGLLECEYLAWDYHRERLRCAEESRFSSRRWRGGESSSRLLSRYHPPSSRAPLRWFSHLLTGALLPNHARREAVAPLDRDSLAP
jgi:hypothetical protein